MAVDDDKSKTSMDKTTQSTSFYQRFYFYVTILYTAPVADTADYL